MAANNCACSTYSVEGIQLLTTILLCNTVGYFLTINSAGLALKPKPTFWEDHLNNIYSGFTVFTI